MANINEGGLIGGYGDQYENDTGQSGVGGLAPGSGAYGNSTGQVGGGIGRPPPAENQPSDPRVPWHPFQPPPPPTVGVHPIPGNDDVDRSFQNALIQQLHQLAMGDRNSAAQQGLRQGYDTARGNTQSLASLHRGFGGVGANNQAINNAQSQLTMQQGGNAAALMAQQQQAATLALQQAYAQMRAGDMGYANTLATGLTGAQGLGNSFLQSILGSDIGRANSMQGIGMNTAQNNLGLENDMSQMNTAFMQQLAQALAGGAGSAMKAFGTNAPAGGGASPTGDFNAPTGTSGIA